MRSKSVVLGWLGVLLTLLKPAIAWVIVALMVRESNTLASVCVFFLMISDMFDGVMFRKSTPKIRCKFGLGRRVMDAVGDRLCICLVFLAMVKMTDLPFYIYSVELAREVILISIVEYSWAVHRPIVEPNNISRTATFFTGLSAIAWLNSEHVLTIVLISCTGLIGAIGLYKYYQTMRANIQDWRRG